MVIETIIHATVFSISRDVLYNFCQDEESYMSELVSGGDQTGGMEGEGRKGRSLRHQAPPPLIISLQQLE